MSVQTILQCLEDEAEAEAGALVARAREAASRIVVDATERADATVAVALEQAEPRLRAESARRVNAVRLRLLEERASLTASRVEAAFAAAEGRALAIALGGDRDRWTAAVRGLCRSALDATGPGATAAVRGCDLDVVADLAAESAARLAALPPDASPGVVAVSGDERIRLDATLAVRAERARDLLTDRVARGLGADLEATAPRTAAEASAS
jgi:vacuolar-type H+-ATPase subunit E/Vma4